MSTFWTPGGERPIRSADPPLAEPRPAAGRSPGELDDGGEALTEEEMAAQIAAMQEQVQRTPGEVLVANQLMGFVQVAALYLNLENPRLPDARLAIDAFAAVVEGLGDRLGEAETPLRETLAQLRLAYLEAGG